MNRVRKRLIMKRQIFASKDVENHFKIFSTYDAQENKEEIIKGNLPNFELDVEIDGFFAPSKNLKYGDQLELKSIMDYELTLSDMKEVTSYILGEKAANSLYAKTEMSKSIFRKIINNEYDLSTLKGLGDSRISKIKQKISSNIDIMIVAALLKDNTISEKMAARILNQYPSISKAIHIVKNEPHLLTNVKGVSFSRADKISVYSDASISFEHRLNLATEEILKKNTELGSTYMSLNSFKKRVCELLNLESVNIEYLYTKEDLVITKKIIGYRVTLEQEQMIADNIFKKMTEDRPFPINKEDALKFLSEYEIKENFIFTKTQKEFFSIFVENNVVALLGYAGTGKSALQKVVVELSKYVGWEIAQSAPTGRAAQVMTSYTGIKSSTLHKRFKINQFTKNNVNDAVSNQVEENVLLVDESSMIDILVGYHLTSGVENIDRLVFVGDPEQLPSVGSGRFLQDLIDGGIPHVELQDVFRQSEGGILDMATKARQGKSIVPNNKTKAVKFGKDTIFHQVESEDGEKAVTYYIRLLLNKMNLDDVIVVTPKNVGVLGSENLNQMIQRQFNPYSPDKAEFKNERTRFRIGDTILCNFNKEVPNEFGESVIINNGEIGKFIDIREAEFTYKGKMKVFTALVIDFGGNVVFWPTYESKFLKLGYAITIHKMQGSSSKGIIMIADKSDTYMLNRQLIYTGLTRPREKLILLGSSQAINSAVRKDGSAKRNTMLATYLKQLVHQKENSK